MALTYWAFLYTAAGADPSTDRTALDTRGCRTVLVGMSDPADAIAVAVELVADGVQLIEVCGGFGPVWTARIIEATGGTIPIGSVGYGPEAVDQVHAIFAPPD